MTWQDLRALTIARASSDCIDDLFEDFVDCSKVSCSGQVWSERWM